MRGTELLVFPGFVLLKNNSGSDAVVIRSKRSVNERGCTATAVVMSSSWWN